MFITAGITGIIIQQRERWFTPSAVLLAWSEVTGVKHYLAMVGGMNITHLHTKKETIYLPQGHDLRLNALIRIRDTQLLQEERSLYTHGTNGTKILFLSLSLAGQWQDEELNVGFASGFYLSNNHPLIHSFKLIWHCQIISELFRTCPAQTYNILPYKRNKKQKQEVTKLAVVSNSTNLIEWLREHLTLCKSNVKAFPLFARRRDKTPSLMESAFQCLSSSTLYAMDLAKLA